MNTPTTGMRTDMNWYRSQACWTFVLQNYLPRLALCSLVWEILQLPLYTMWEEPSLARIAYSLMHCTVGDVMIGTVALSIALIVNRAGERADWPYIRIGVGMVAIAVAYTLMSERVNLARGNWSYSELMPILPWIKVGLAPVLQWVLVPLIAWQWANRNASTSSST